MSEFEVDFDFNIKTSWSDDELRLLSNRKNHKIVMVDDGVFKWYHNIRDFWEIHSIKDFEDFKLPTEWLNFWLYCWSKELEQRTAKKERKLRRIKESKSTPIEKKVKILRTVFTGFSLQDIANELGVSLSTVKRALKEP